jgi:hypothetical protein
MKFLPGWSRRLAVVLVLALFVLALGAAVVWLSNSTWLVRQLAGPVCGRVLREFSLERFTVGEQRCRLEGVCVWKNLSLSGILRGKPLEFRLEQLEWRGWRSVFGPGRVWKFVLEGADLRWEPGHLAGGTVALRLSWPAGQPVFDGQWQLQSLTWDKLRLTSARGKLSGDASFLRLEEMKAEAYGGHIAGALGVQFASAGYTLDLALDQLSTLLMGDIDASVPQQIDGMVSGQLKVEGTAERMDALQAGLHLSSGGAVNAALLGSLLSYLPQSREKKLVERLVKAGGKLAVELFSVRIANVGYGLLAGELHLTSKAVNTALNLGYDIRTDGAWQNLLTYWQSLSEQLQK